MTLKQATDNTVEYRDKLVKVCGVATKQFENVRITEHRDGNWRDTAAGLGVNWLSNEPITKLPEQRCITGKLEPLGGWALFDRRSSGQTEDIVISTGHSHDVVITQYSRKRD
ncbi:hypothetical protein [Litorimonas cladophorae]|uniref:hypothetical protein n=1 Tax=Litorimonas cladophorae TaxID=1220491 RepID=UPI00167B2561|nr:hypothetical protein [Litorimonas cladophorae]